MIIGRTELKWRIIGLLGKALMEGIFRTSRTDFIGYNRLAASPRFIAAIWHSRLLYFTHFSRRYQGAVLVSASKDGEIMARVLQRLGHETVRGSTTRGGLRALAGMIRMVRAGKTAAVIPDGPQGPRFVVQPGIITLAKKTGVPILPMTYSAKDAWIAPSWDRFMLPRPFTRCLVITGNPVFVRPEADSSEETACRIELQEELMRITRQADAHFGHRTPE